MFRVFTFTVQVGSSCLEFFGFCIEIFRRELAGLSGPAMIMLVVMVVVII